MVAMSLFNPIHANNNVIPALKTARCSLPQTVYTLVKGIGSRKGGKEEGMEAIVQLDFMWNSGICDLLYSLVSHQK